MLKNSLILPMSHLTWDKIVDFLGAIRYLGDDPGGRKPSYGRGKPAQTAQRKDGAREKAESALPLHGQADPEAALGHEIDVTA